MPALHRKLVVLRFVFALATVASVRFNGFETSGMRGVHVCRRVSRTAPVCCMAEGEEHSASLFQNLQKVSARRGEVVVVKYGGHAMTDESLAVKFAADVALLQSLGVCPVVVHGGGPQIANMLKRLEIESSFVRGLRVTDAATMEVAEMVLCGSINKKISSAITLAGARAIGMSGRDAQLVLAEQVDPELGLVGEPKEVKPEILRSLIKDGIVPVIAPIATDTQGNSYNVNADTMAGAIAAALKAKTLLLLTDVAGVLDSNGSLLTEVTIADCERLVEDGTASGGMIPKLGTATAAVAGGVGSAVIMDGRVPHCSLLYLFTDHGVGTAVVAD